VWLETLPGCQEKQIAQAVRIWQERFKVSLESTDNEGIHKQAWCGAASVPECYSNQLSAARGHDGDTALVMDLGAIKANLGPHARHFGIGNWDC
jgi:hypothetical protein